MSTPPDSLEAQSDDLALKSFKYTMYTVFGFIIVAAYFTINTEIPKKEAPPPPAHHDHH